MSELDVYVAEGVVLSVEGNACCIYDNEGCVSVVIEKSQKQLVKRGDIVSWKIREVEIEREGSIVVSYEEFDLQVINKKISKKEKKDMLLNARSELIAVQIREGVLQSDLPEKWILNTSKDCSQEELNRIAKQIEESAYLMYGFEPVYWNLYFAKFGVRDSVLTRMDLGLWSILILKGEKDSYDSEYEPEDAFDELEQLEKDFVLLNALDFQTYEDALTKYVSILKKYENETNFSKNFTNSHYRFFREDEVIEVILMHNAREYMQMDMVEKKGKQFWNEMEKE